MNDFKLVIEQFDKANNKVISCDDLSELLDSLPLDYYAFILHDSDYLPDLSLKRKHYHIVLRTIDSTTKRVVIGWFANYLAVNRNIISCLPSSDIIHDVRYLCHLDEQSKFIYQLYLVRSSHPSITVAMLLNDLTNDKLVPFQQFNIDYLISIIKKSKSIADVFSLIGLSRSKQYAYLINCMWRSYQK